MYNELYAAWKREVSDATLGTLPADFYSRLSEYIKKLLSLVESADKKSVKYNLLVTEERNVRAMVEELFNVRYKKIIDQITETQKIPTEVLTPEELRISRSFFNFKADYSKLSDIEKQGGTTAEPQAAVAASLSELAKSMDKIEHTVTPQATEPPKSAVSEDVPKVVIVKPAPKRVTVRFSKPIPAIMGADMKSYGPFAVEDVASLPELNAKILVKQGLAVAVEVS